jgi:hypothetical protein
MPAAASLPLPPPIAFTCVQEKMQKFLRKVLGTWKLDSYFVNLHFFVGILQKIYTFSGES